ncbi:hypothetical protein SAMN05443247_06894 [Bradyrhizobium erythrophlei]|nr:hypothetical protein SAMN05443247_06894 [Bradyrhizobium erythrophlei]
MMHKYDAALAALEKVRRHDDNNEFATLSRLLMRASEKAAAWNQDLDPHERQRRADQSFLDSGAPSIVTKLKGVIDLADEHPDAFDAVAAKAVAAIGITPKMMDEAGFVFNATSGSRSGPFMRSVLLILHREFEKETNSATRTSVKGEKSGGPHRHIFGPLSFPKRVDTVTRMPNPRITGLQFEMIFYMRRYTGLLPTREIVTGDALPSCGRPHYDILAEFSRSAIGYFPTDNGAAFKKALRAYSVTGKPVVWEGWTPPARSRGRVTSHWAPAD